MGNLENVKIVCVGFSTSDEAKENILIVFKKLLEEAPYNAFIEVTLEKIDAGFSGKVHVTSIAGEFASMQIDMTPQSLVNHLYRDLQAQLISWKSRRFSSPDTLVTA